MRDHNNNNKNDERKGMLWMMMLCCVLPILFIVVFGAGSKAFGAPTWIVIGGIAVMIIAHFFMMGRSHKHSDEEKSVTDGENENKDSKDKKDHSGHGCCH